MKKKQNPHSVCANKFEIIIFQEKIVLGNQIKNFNILDILL